MVRGGAKAGALYGDLLVNGQTRLKIVPSPPRWRAVNIFCLHNVS